MNIFWMQTAKTKSITTRSDAQFWALENLKYETNQGLFYKWSNSGYKLCGSVNPEGYVMINIFGIPILAHRLAWLFLHNQIAPDNDIIDHKNGIRHDNRPQNLQIITKSENRIKARPNKKGSSYSDIPGKNFYRRLRGQQILPGPEHPFLQRRR